MTNYFKKLTMPLDNLLHHLPNISDAESFGHHNARNFMGEVDASRSHFNNAALEILLQSIKSNQKCLRILHLQDNFIDDEGVKTLALFLREYKGMYVDGIPCGDKYLHLSKGITMVLSDDRQILRTITEINLSDNFITDKGAELLLEAIRQNTYITSLNLDGNSISRKILKEIEQACQNNMRKSGKLRCPEQQEETTKDNTPAMIFVPPSTAPEAKSSETSRLIDRKNLCLIL